MDAIFFCEDDGSTTGLPNLKPSAAGVVRDLDYTSGAGDGETVHETLRLALEGQPFEIETFLSSLERALARATLEADLPGGDPLFLACRVAPGSETWRSKILSGQATLATGSADQRSRGSQRCTLEIRRVDGWERQDGPLLARMVNAQDENAGHSIEVDNHADAAHTNLVDLPAETLMGENITGDLPAPATLTIDLPGPGSAYPVTFFVGESWRKNVEQLTPVYPGESGAARTGATGSLVSDANCAGGQCLSLSWNGAQEQEVWGVDLPAADTRILAGYPALPLLRLQAAPPAETWYRWKVYALASEGETLCGQSPIQAAEAGCQLLSGPALNLPPWLVDQTGAYAAPALRLVLAVQAAGAGAHALAVDSLSLMGLDGWRIYRPLTGQASNGIVDDPQRGTLYRFEEHAQSHTAEGPGFTLQPGRSHRFTFLALSHTPSGKTVPLDLTMWVWVNYRPRKRHL